MEIRNSSVNRLDKINNLIQHELGKIIQKEIDTDALLTITRVDVSPTLEHATIMISVYPPSEETAMLEKLNSKIYGIQQALNSRLQMRPVPKIRFEIDHFKENAEKIEKIFDRIN